MEQQRPADRIFKTIQGYAYSKDASSKITPTYRLSKMLDHIERLNKILNNGGYTNEYIDSMMKQVWDMYSHVQVACDSAGDFDPDYSHNGARLEFYGDNFESFADEHFEDDGCHVAKTHMLNE